MTTLQPNLKNKIDSLFKPVDSSILGFYRIVVGLILLYEYTSLENYFVKWLAKSKFFFKYDGFEWIHLLPAEQLSYLFLILKISAALFALGLFFRLNAIIQFTGWTYLFLSDKGHYNNHFYLISILLFLFVLVDANKWMAIRFRKSKTNSVPFWQIFVFQLQIFIVYFYGGLSKFDSDWLQGYPLTYTLQERAGNLPSFLSSFIVSNTGVYFMAYAGIVFDLSVGFLLFSKKLRKWAMIPICLFHLLNYYLWSIGSFPLLMLISSLLFFDPSLPRKLVNTLIAKKNNNTVINIQKKRKQLISVFFIVFFAFQFLFPFRHLLYKGDPAWTGEGHLFAWRMMLVSSDDAVRMKVRVPADNVEFYVDFYSYMNAGQFRRAMTTPTCFLQFVHFIKNEIYVNAGITNLEIKLEIYKSVNYRKPALLNDTTLNYANITNNPFKHAEWIRPWKKSDGALRPHVSDYENWKEYIE